MPGYGLKRWIGVIVMGSFLGGLALGHPKGGSLEFSILSLGFLLVGLGIYKLITVIDSILRKRGTSIGELYLELEKKRGPKVTAIGGGTGLSTLLRGLRKYTGNITAIVTVSDEGGSTGRIRKDWGGIAIGDIRNCILSLAEDDNIWASVLKYRFERGELKGHSLGNLLLLALSEMEGDFLSGLQKFKEMLGVTAEVFPITLSDVKLRATFEDGSMVEGETEIPKTGKRITKLEVIPSKASLSPKVRDSIMKADIIAIGPGSLYTSIIPNLVFSEIVEAIKTSKALKVYICNIMTQPGETDGFTVLDHLREIEKYIGAEVIDYVIVNTGSFSESVLKRYESEGATPVRLDIPLDCKRPIFICSDLVLERDGIVRHHPYKLAEVILGLVKEG